jgi:hypothetical protein
VEGVRVDPELAFAAWDVVAADELVAQCQVALSTLSALRERLAVLEAAAGVDWEGPAHSQFVERSRSLSARADQLMGELGGVGPAVVATGEEIARTKAAAAAVSPAFALWEAVVDR